MTAKSTPLTIIAILIVGLATSITTAESGSFALRVGRILPVSPDLPAEIEDGLIIVREGQIAAIGSHADIAVPPDLPLIEIPDGTVTPGFVAAASDLGGRHRGDESVAAGYRALDAFDCFDDYAATLASGTTTVHISTGTHRLLTGQNAVVRLGGPPADRIVRDRADLMINLSPSVHKPPPDVTFPFPASADVAILPPRRQRPASRLDQLLALDESIRDALADTKQESFNIHTMALAQAWQDNLPLRFRVDEPADVLEAIKFLRQRKRLGYMVGGARIGSVADAIGASRVPLVYQPDSRFRSPGSDVGTDPNARNEPDLAVLGSELAQLAIAPPVGQSLSDLRLTAIQATRAGLPREVALRAITRTAAEILGVDDRLGSLAVGKDADLVVLTGDPLETSSHVQRVYIRGREVFRPPSSSGLVVKAAMIWAGPDKWIANGQILVEDGKIVAVGPSVPHPRFARVIDLRPGGFVTPGFIDAYSHLGLDGDRTAIGTDLRLSRLVGVADVTDARVSAAGITTVLMSPYGISSKGTTAAAVKTAGRRPETRVIRDPAAVLLTISQSADPLDVASQLDAILATGQKYLDSWTKYDKDLKAFLEKQEKDEKSEGDKDDRPQPPQVNEALEPLKALLEKKVPAVVSVTTSAQIREVLASLVDKRELPVTLLNADGASAHAAKLAEKKITVIVPPNVLRKEQYRDYHQADDLSRNDVAIAFQSDAEDGARHLPAVVMFAVERGLDANAALAALTVGAAKALKIDDRVGTIEPGKDADLVLFSSHPFVDGGRVLRVIVDGKEVKP